MVGLFSIAAIRPGLPLSFLAADRYNDRTNAVEHILLRLRAWNVRGISMAIYSISDLHLSFAKPKPMDVFGPVWENHAEKIRQNWDALVSPSDIVLLPGDLSWALRLSEAEPDLDFVRQRPGRKVLTRGNHDFWWQRLVTSRLQKTVDKDMTFLQGTSVVMDEVGITGTRGWRIDRELGARSSDEGLVAADSTDPGQAAKIYRRELAYLEKGLQSIPDSVETRIAMLHYPPFDEHLEPNEFAHLLTKYAVTHLVYGHIHLGLGNWIDGEVDRINYRLVSADVVDFVPQLIIG